MSATRAYPYLFNREKKIIEPTRKKAARGERASVKLMLTLQEENFSRLAKVASDRDVTLQELIRAVIIPEWTRASLEPHGLARRIG